MLRRNSSSLTFAPCANSAVDRRYGGRKTNVASNHAIANSALSTELSVSAAMTGTVCDAAASDRLSAWLRRARPMKPRMSASSGGLVRSGRGSRSRHSVNGMEASSGSTQQTWSTCASVNPSRSRTAVAGNRRLEATRLRQTCSPDRLTPRQASSTTSAQAKAAVPSTNVTAPIGLPSACSRLLGSSGETATTRPAPIADDTNTTSSERSTRVRCRVGAALGSSETSMVLHPRTVTMPSRVCRLIAAAATPTSWASTSRATITQKTSPSAADSACAVSRDRNGDQMPTATASVSAITRRSRPPVVAARRGRAARARPPTPPGRYSPPRGARSGRPRPSCWPGASRSARAAS